MVLTVDRRVRRFYVAILLLSVAEVALLGALAFALARLGPALPPDFPVALALAACGAAFGAGLVALVLATVAALHSHRTLGATRSILDALRALREGRDPGPVRLRPGDALLDLAEELNALAERLRGAKGARS